MKHFFTLKAAATCLLLSLLFTAKAQLTIQAGIPPAQLVQNTLLSPGVIVSNIQIQGNAAQIAKFNGANSNIGLNSGIILSTGNVFFAPGPNQDFVNNADMDHSLPGDADLDQLTPDGTNDAYVLEFDFVAYNDTVQFNYVFASEEYPEFVNLGVSDVFAFFITGPGYPTPTNIALIPGTNQPISIDNVNDFNNAQYYIDNTNGQTVNYDGFTVKLTALAVVQPCSTYTLKIAIADVGDGAYDSAVFLEAGSFNAGTANITISAGASTNINDSLLIEGCVNGILELNRSGQLSDTTVVHYTVGGTATGGDDYPALPDSVTFYPGDTLIQFNLDAYADGISEGTETITITLIPDPTECQNQTPQTVTILLLNTDPLAVNFSMPDTMICDATVSFTATGTGGRDPYTYEWSTGDTTQTLTVTPTESTTYIVTVTDSCGNTITDSLTVDVVCGVIVPNVFTPNEDGVNDKFVIANLELYPGSELVVYNRWGRKVYSSSDYKNNWDGGNLSAGVYYYTLDVVAKPEKKHGTVTILK